jgi:hypothetical protein
MELVISGIVVAKSVLFCVLSGYLAFMFLFPVSDQPTTRGQKLFWIIAEVVLFCFIFDLFSVKFVA